MGTMGLALGPCSLPGRPTAIQTSLQDLSENMGLALGPCSLPGRPTAIQASVQDLSENMGTMGLALGPCSLPGTYILCTLLETFWRISLRVTDDPTF